MQGEGDAEQDYHDGSEGHAPRRDSEHGGREPRGDHPANITGGRVEPERLAAPGDEEVRNQRTRRRRVQSGADSDDRGSCQEREVSRRDGEDDEADADQSEPAEQ